MRSLRQGVEEEEVAIAGVMNKSNRPVQGLAEISLRPQPLAPLLKGFRGGQG